MKKFPQLASLAASILPTMAGKDTNGTGNGKPPSGWSSILDQHSRWLVYIGSQV
jgi:hypothetical protein